MTDSPPRQRWLHPGWLALILLSGVAAAAIIIFWVPISRREALVARIRERSGSVRIESGGPKWLRDLIGAEKMAWFDRITVVDLSGTQADDADLRAVMQLPYLEMVYAMRTPLISATMLDDFQAQRPDVILYRSGGPVFGVGGETVSNGMVIRRLLANSGAANAGLMEGDVIQKIDGNPIPNWESLVQIVSKHRPHDRLMVDYERNGAPSRTMVELGAWE